MRDRERQTRAKQRSVRLTREEAVLQRRDPAVALVDTRTREQYLGLSISRFSLENPLQQTTRIIRLVILQQLPSVFDLLSGFARDRLLKPALNLILRKGTDELVHNLPIDEELDVRNTPDFILQGHGRMLLRIHLGQHPRPVTSFCETFEDGAENAARSTPICPEIDENRNFMTALYYFSFKILNIDHRHLHNSC